MAAISGGSIGRLLHSLHRIKLSKAAKLNYVYAAFFHNSSSLNAGFLGFGEDDDSGSFMDNLIEAHSQLSANHVAEITDMVLLENKQGETSPEARYLKQIQENEEPTQLKKHVMQREDTEDEAISCSQSLLSDRVQIDNHLVRPLEEVHHEMISKVRDDEIILLEGHRMAEFAEPIKEISQSWLESTTSPHKDKVTDLEACEKDSSEYVVVGKKVTNDLLTVGTDKTELHSLNMTSDTCGIVLAPLSKVDGKKIQNDTVRMPESYDTIEQSYAMAQMSDSAETSQASFVLSKELLDYSEFVHNQPDLEAKHGPKNDVMLDFPTPKTPANYEDELSIFQKENHSSLEQGPSVAKGDLVIPEESSSLHDYQEVRNTTLIVPLEATFPLDPQPIDLTEDPVIIQLESHETFHTNSNKKSEYKEDLLQDVMNLYPTQDSKDTNQRSEKHLQNEFQEAHMVMTPSSTPVQAKEAHLYSSHSNSKQNSEEQEWEDVSSVHAVSLPVETRAVLQVPEDTKDVKIGTLIAVMAAEGDDWRTVEIPSVEGASVSEVNAQPIADTSTSIPVADAGHVNYGPSVRLLLERYGLTADQVTPGGPHGILLKGDVLQTIKEKKLQPRVLPTVSPPEVPKSASAPSAPATKTPTSVPPPVSGVSEDGYNDVEVTNMRRTIAKRLLQSKSGIAHSYGTLECCIDRLLALRKQFKNEGINVSVNDLIIKAVATALSSCPEMNCIWQGDQLMMSDQVDISVAVATPAGLITPIVYGADTLGVEGIATKVRDLAGRARENKLKLDEFQGGTFTISNLGMFGITEFSAIINPPQCGILAVGGGRKSLDESGTPVAYMTVTLSYDRAAIDDDTAAIFLDTLKQILEDPTTMILGDYTSLVSHPMVALL